MKKQEYHAGKFVAFSKLVAGIIRANPRCLDDEALLIASITASLPPEMRDRSRCANCGASMQEYIYAFDCWDALLVIKMGEAMKHNLRKGMDFTVANQIRVPELDASHAIKCRTTQTAKLGLIAQLRSKNGGGRVPGVWVITKRGFEALAGKPVPAKVRVWRKKIEERYDEMITIDAALKSHVEFVTAQVRKGRKVKQDMRTEAVAYKPSDWFEFDVHEGALF